MSIDEIKPTISVHETELIRDYPLLQIFADQNIYISSVWSDEKIIKEITNNFRKKFQKKCVANKSYFNCFFKWVLGYGISMYIFSDKLINLSNTFIQTGIPMADMDYLVSYACHTRCIDWLEWWVQSGITINKTYNAIYLLCEEGHIDILNWWVESGLELSYDAWTIAVSINGNSPVLKWWFDSGYPIKYDHNTIQKLLTNNNTEVLELWIGHNLPIADIDSDFSEALVLYGAYNSFKFIIQHQIPFEYDEKMIDCASELHRVNFLQLFYNANIKFKYTNMSLDKLNDSSATKYCCDTLDWWIKSGLELKYTEKCVDDACTRFHSYGTKFMELWQKSGLEIKYTVKALQNVLEKKSYIGLKWWLDSGLELKYNVDTFYILLGTNSLDLLQLWFDHGLKMNEYISEDNCNSCFREKLDITFKFLLEYFPIVTLMLNNTGIFYYACMTANIKILNILYEYMPDNFNAPLIADLMDSVEKLDWLKKRIVPFTYTAEAINYASRYCRIDVLKWWFDSGLELKFNENSLNFSLPITARTESENIGLSKYHVWKPANIFNATPEEITNYFNNNKLSDSTIQVLKLWLNSDLEPQYNINFIKDFVAKYHLESRVYDI